VIDVGPGAGEAGGRILACGPPRELAHASESRTAPRLARALEPPNVAFGANASPKSVTD
jgi:excinuclease ABC subunit A